MTPWDAFALWNLFYYSSSKLKIKKNNPVQINSRSEIVHISIFEEARCVFYLNSEKNILVPVVVCLFSL